METLELGILALDELFEEKIPAPSIFAICGAPGTGKTTLALQLAYSLQIESEKKNKDYGKPAFLTFDASTEQVLAVAQQYKFPETYGHPPLAERRQPLIYSLDKEITLNGRPQTIRDIIREIISPPEASADKGESSALREQKIVDGFFALVNLTIEALKADFDKEYRLIDTSGRIGIIVIDGLSTILAYVPERYRRMVLHHVISHLRSWYKLAAGILTFELPTVHLSRLSSASSVQFEPEHYLADIVFWLTLKEIIPGKRRRMIEILKARRASFRLGEHSVWLMHPNRVKEFQKVPLRGFDRLKPGFIVFPSHKAPHVTTPQKAPPPLERISTGIPCLDEMFGTAFAEDTAPTGGTKTSGGVFEGSTTAVLGSPGTGKTLIGLAFLLAGLPKSQTDDSSQALQVYAPRIFLLVRCN